MFRNRPSPVLKPVWLSWPAFGGFAAILGVAFAGGRRWRKKLRERAGKVLPELAEWRLEALSPELHKLKGKRLEHRFEVGQLLARGGFANVFEGRDVQRGGMACAIKIFRQELLDRKWMERRFQQEVAALERIHHPNVVGIMGAAESQTERSTWSWSLLKNHAARLLGEGQADSRADCRIYASGRKRTSGNSRTGHLSPRSEAGKYHDSGSA